MFASRHNKTYFPVGRKQLIDVQSFTGPGLLIPALNWESLFITQGVRLDRMPKALFLGRCWRSWAWFCLSFCGRTVCKAIPNPAVRCLEHLRTGDSPGVWVASQRWGRKALRLSLRPVSLMLYRNKLASRRANPSPSWIAITQMLPRWCGDDIRIPSREFVSVTLGVTPFTKGPKCTLPPQSSGLSFALLPFLSVLCAYVCIPCYSY